MGLSTTCDLPRHLVYLAWLVVNEWETDAGCEPTPFHTNPPPYAPDARLIGSSYGGPWVRRSARSSESATA